MRVWLAASLALALSSGDALAQEPIPVGGQFQINTYTAGNQDLGSVAGIPDKGFVVTWSSDGSYGTDTSLGSIQGQRFDVEGSPLAAEFQVNSYTSHKQYRPAVAADAEGNFVVVWESYGSYSRDSIPWSIQGQRYDADGIALNGQFQVSGYSTRYQRSASVAMGAQGGFVVTWESFVSGDLQESDIYAQRYDAGGMRIGTEFRVNDYTPMKQTSPSVAMGVRGNYVVAWQSYFSLTDDDLSIQAQRFDSRGTRLGEQFQVNAYTTDRQIMPSVAMGDHRSFIVAWSSEGSYGTDTDLFSVQARRYDGNGVAFGTESQVNAYTTDLQVGGHLAIDAQGNFVVTWYSYGSYGTHPYSTSTQGQRFSPEGLPLGGQFQVSTFTNSVEFDAHVAMVRQDSFVAVWGSFDSFGTDAEPRSVQGRLFTIPIFTDGFESGDVSGWSSSEP